jgi:hypothetical protein
MQQSILSMEYSSVMTFEPKTVKRSENEYIILQLVINNVYYIRCTAVKQRFILDEATCSGHGVL